MGSNMNESSSLLSPSVRSPQGTNTSPLPDGPTLRNFVDYVETGTSLDKDPAREESNEAKHARRKLVRATVVCMCFIVVEVIGGYIAGSLAIMTDAAHLLSDVAGFMISLFALYLAERRPTVTLSYGFKRAEIIGAIISVMLIWVLTGVLLWAAVLRTHDILYLKKSPGVDGKVMFTVACFGLVANMVLLAVLGHDHGHSHGGEAHGHSHERSHGHSHGHSTKDKTHRYQEIATDAQDDHRENISDAHGHSHGKAIHSNHESKGESHEHSHGKGDIINTGNKFSSDLEIKIPTESSVPNINVSAAYVHAIGDLIQSIGVCIAGALIWAFPASDPKNHMVQLADPGATFLFSMLVVYSTYEIMSTSVRVLMEGVPSGLDPIQIAQNLANIQNVLGVHHLHVWSISVGYPSLSVHLLVAENTNHEMILQKAQHVMREHGIDHSTIQIEQQNKQVCGPDDCSGTPCNAYAISCDNGNCFDDFRIDVETAYGT